MKIYLVGGAVRDKLLGLPVTDRDWVVVGARQNEMLDLGFAQVGNDFPVFLHPQTKEEYALARTERKTAPGHTGFVFDANETVTLEQDLARRDLTINAIAETADGELIDPYNGQDDLAGRVLDMSRLRSRRTRCGFYESRVSLRDFTRSAFVSHPKPMRSCGRLYTAASWRASSASVCGKSSQRRW